MRASVYHGGIAQKCIYGATKGAIIFGVIVIDILVLTGGLALVGYFNASFLANVVGLIALGYAVCGSMITYNAIKYSLLNLKHIFRYYNGSNMIATFLESKPGWGGVKNATRGRLALTGGVIYLIIVLFGLLIYTVTELGVEQGSSMYSLALIAVFIGTISGIVPLVEHVERLTKKANGAKNK